MLALLKSIKPQTPRNLTGLSFNGRMTGLHPVDVKGSIPSSSRFSLIKYSDVPDVGLRGVLLRRIKYGGSIPPVGAIWVRSTTVVLSAVNRLVASSILAVPSNLTHQISSITDQNTGLRIMNATLYQHNQRNQNSSNNTMTLRLVGPRLAALNGVIGSSNLPASVLSTNSLTSKTPLSERGVPGAGSGLSVYGGYRSTAGRQVVNPPTPGQHRLITPQFRERSTESIKLPCARLAVRTYDFQSYKRVSTTLHRINFLLDKAS